MMETLAEAAFPGHAPHVYTVAAQWGLLGVFGVVVALLIPQATRHRRAYLLPSAGHPRDVRLSLRLGAKHQAPRLDRAGSCHRHRSRGPL